MHSCLLWTFGGSCDYKGNENGLVCRLLALADLQLRHHVFEEAEKCDEVIITHTLLLYLFKPIAPWGAQAIDNPSPSFTVASQVQLVLASSWRAPPSGSRSGFGVWCLLWVSFKGVSHQDPPQNLLGRWFLSPHAPSSFLSFRPF